MAPSPDRIKLTLQHKLLEYKQVEVQNSNMKKALDNDSHIVSHQLLHQVGTNLRGLLDPSYQGG